MNEKVYYQPIMSDAQWNEHRDFNSFDVYNSFEKAKADFPDCEIGAYSGDDIENPNFVDEVTPSDKHIELEVFNKIHIKNTLEKLVGRRFNKQTLETYLSEKFGNPQKLDITTQEDDDATDFNFLGGLDYEVTRGTKTAEPIKVHIYGYYDIYFLKMRQAGFDGADVYITEVAVEFE